MKLLLAAFLAVFAAGFVPAAHAARQQGQTAPAAPAAPGSATGPQVNGHPMVTVGKVGQRTYGWTNGWAWMSLGDDAKVSMVVGIEQGIVFSVRENWDAVPKNDQQTLVNTAERLTVGGVSFDQVVLDIDKLYLDPDNDQIPVVDAYLYVVLELKKTPDGQLKQFLDRLQKTYALPPIVMKPLGKP
jgi:hypothetical protein